MDHECRLRKLSNSIKCSNIRIMGVPEDGEREKGAEGLFEQIIAEDFPNLRKDTDIQIQDAQKTPIKFNKSCTTPRHIIVKSAKQRVKERILGYLGGSVS